MHWSKGDTWQLGFGWLDERIYGEGGFSLYIGKWYLNFWKDPGG